MPTRLVLDLCLVNFLYSTSLVNFSLNLGNKEKKTFLGNTSFTGNTILCKSLPINFNFPYLKFSISSGDIVFIKTSKKYFFPFTIINLFLSQFFVA